VVSGRLWRLAMEEFNRLGIQFVSLRENVDTTSAQGRLVFQIFSAISEFERELVRSRVRSGLALARARGRHIGRPRLVLDLTAIHARRREGASWRQLSTELGIPACTILRAARRCETPADGRC